MKKILLLFSTLITSLSFSQTISKFTSNPNTSFTILTPSNIDQSPTGANTSWSFSGFSNGNTTSDTFTIPTLGESLTFPGTTNVLSVNTQGTSAVKNIFLKENTSGVSITGFTDNGVTINYNSSNAFIGLFPLNQGYNSTTPVSGTFTYISGGTNIPGTFSGTITTTIDAFGTLTLSDFNYSKNVTRLKQVQTLSLSITGMPNIGTFSQTSYYYYNNTTNNIDLRYNSALLVVPAVAINIPSETLEFNSTDNLSSEDYTLASNINIFPNPSNDFINISLPLNETIRGIKIIDNQGREILSNNINANKLDTSNLQSGLYFLSIETESGKLANKKFIKQ